MFFYKSILVVEVLWVAWSDSALRPNERYIARGIGSVAALGGVDEELPA